MANSVTSIFASVLISLVLGAGVAFVSLPMVYPSLQNPTTTNNNNNNSSTPPPADVDKGVVQSVLKSWINESYIPDSQLNWVEMNVTQANFTIGSNSKIIALFSAPYLIYLDPTFTGFVRYQVALIISKGNTTIGNSTTQIEYYHDGAASGSNIELSFFPTIGFSTGKLSAGTYNCSVWWQSINDAPGSNYLLVSSHNVSITYHFDRWMLLQEVIS